MARAMYREGGRVNVRARSLRHIQGSNPWVEAQFVFTIYTVYDGGKEYDVVLPDCSKLLHLRVGQLKRVRY